MLQGRAQRREQGAVAPPASELGDGVFVAKLGISWDLTPGSGFLPALVAVAAELGWAVRQQSSSTVPRHSDAAGAVAKQIPAWSLLALLHSCPLGIAIRALATELRASAWLMAGGVLAAGEGSVSWELVLRPVPTGHPNGI